MSGEITSVIYEVWYLNYTFSSAYHNTKGERGTSFDTEQQAYQKVRQETKKFTLRSIVNVKKKICCFVLM